MTDHAKMPDDPPKVFVYPDMDDANVNFHSRKVEYTRTDIHARALDVIEIAAGALEMYKDLGNEKIDIGWQAREALAAIEAFRK